MGGVRALDTTAITNILLLDVVLLLPASQEAKQESRLGGRMGDGAEVWSARRRPLMQGSAASG